MASNKHIELGRSSEDLAVDYLRENGYRIIKRNYKTKLGEIDIIAKDKDVLCFIEVKSRKTERFGSPREAVSNLKQRKISRVALAYLKENNLLDSKARFDVVAIIYPDNKPQFELIKDAFELEEKFLY